MSKTFKLFQWPKAQPTRSNQKMKIQWSHVKVSNHNLLVKHRLQIWAPSYRSMIISKLKLCMKRQKSQMPYFSLRWNSLQCLRIAKSLWCRQHLNPCQLSLPLMPTKWELRLSTVRFRAWPSSVKVRLMPLRKAFRLQKKPSRRRQGKWSTRLRVLPHLLPKLSSASKESLPCSANRRHPGVLSKLSLALQGSSINLYSSAESRKISYQ